MFRQTRSSALKQTNYLPAKPKKITDEKKDIDELKKFSMYYDDSSDDDEIKYDIAERWNDSEESKESSKSKSNLSNDELLSFVAHAAGIKLFYSKEVNQSYFNLKNKLLSEVKEDNNAISQLQHLILLAFNEAANKAFAMVEKFSMQAEQKQTIELLAQSKNKFLADFSNQMNAKVQNNLITFVRWLKKIKYSKESQLNELSWLEKDIANDLTATFKKYFSVVQTKLDRKDIKESLLGLVRDKINEISKSLKFDRLSNAAGKNSAVSLLSLNVSLYPNFYSILKTILENHTPVRGYVHTMLMSELTHPEQMDKLLYAYIEDIVAIQRNKVKSALSSKEELALKNYLSVSDDALLDELTTGFTRVQHRLLEEAMQSLRRPTLGKSHEGVSTNVYTFYANLRLANCSQKRTIANSQNSIFKTDKTMSRIWRLSQEMRPSVLETQMVLKSLGRKDKVEDAGNYETIYEDIKQIQQFFINTKNIRITDATIAEWLREIFQGKIPQIGNKFEQDEVLNKLQTIAYLLFGCEPVRNPAIHVLNQMLLDLIIANKDWSFEEALTGKKNGVAVDEKIVKRMPMSPEGAVAVARALAADYREFMPFPYSYPGIEDGKGVKFGKVDLIKYEARVMRAWLELTGFNHDKTVKKDLAANILEYIEKHLEKWAPVDALKTDLLCEKSFGLK